MAAELNIEQGANNTIVLSGEIDTHTSPLLKEHLDTLDNATCAVLDLAAVSFISSAGLTAMLTAQSRLKAAGGSLTVQNSCSRANVFIVRSDNPIGWQPKR
jgi:anti-anti-sigma factor